MNEQTLKGIGYSLLLIAAMVSIAFVQVLKPTSLAGGALFSTWLLLPYVVLALLLMFWSRDRTSVMAGLAVSVVVVGGGLLFLTDIVFLHPDPQGGIAVLFAPLYQGIGIAVLAPLANWLIRKFSI